MGRRARGVQVVTEMRVRREVNGWTRQQLADRVAATFPAHPRISAEMVEGWELREHTPSELYAPALCAVLDGASSLAELGLGGAPDAHAWWTWAAETERQAEVRRRQLLQDGLTLSAVALLPVDPLAKWANWFGGRLQVDHRTLGEMEALSTRIAQRYGAVGAEGSLPAARSLAQTGIHLLRRGSMSPQGRQRLGSIAADASGMAAEFAVGVGDLAEARRWVHYAGELAREAGDPRLQVQAMIGEAYLASPVNAGPRGGGWDDLDSAVSAAQRAAELASRASAEVRVLASLALARDAAGAGDGPTAFAALAGAERALDGVGADGPGWGWFSGHGELAGCNPERLAGTGGFVRLQLGDPAGAIALLAPAMAGAATDRRRAWVGGHLARAWAGAGDPELACSTATAALDAGEASGWVWAGNLVRSARDDFDAAWVSRPGVIALDQRLRATPDR
ncbi:MAG: hypothetical protein ACRDZO_21235 [Egibacteraceae bacterium]